MKKQGPYSYGEENDGWYLENLYIGEKLGHGDQIAYALDEDDARRISACLNACIDLSDDALEGGWTAKGMISYAKSLEQQIEALKAARVGLVSALNALVDDINALTSESHGVAGLHRNGDVATWEEILPGGRFERLGNLELAESAIAKATMSDPSIADVKGGAA